MGNEFLKFVTIDGSVTKSAANDAYAAGDVIGLAATTGANIAFDVASYFTVNEPIKINRVQLFIGMAAVPASLTSGFNLYLFNNTPSVQLDNAALTLQDDELFLQSRIALPTPEDVGEYAYSESTLSDKIVKIDSNLKLYGVLQTISGYTPADTSATLFTVRLHIQRMI
jgi:hypothetical protein